MNMDPKYTYTVYKTCLVEDGDDQQPPEDGGDEAVHRQLVQLRLCILIIVHLDVLVCLLVYAHMHAS